MTNKTLRFSDLCPSLIDRFVALHVHSEYSNLRLLDSTNKIKDMILHVANNLKQTAMALTDHESVAGHPEYLQTVEELKSEGLIPLDFKPILGNEIYLVDQHTYEEAIETNGSMRFYHFLLLAKNKKGHDQLRELSSRAWERERTLRGMERTPTYYSDIEEIIGENKGNIIASTACLGSRFAQLALTYARYEQAKETGEIDARLTGAKLPYNMKLPEMVAIKPESCDVALEQLSDELYEFITWCQNIFGEDFYIEIQPSEMEDQIMYNKVAQRIASAYNIPMIITTDAHYLSKENRPVHESFLTSDSDGEGNREVADFYSTTYFFTSEELISSLWYLGADNIQEMVENTQNIAIKCEFYSLAHNQVIPKIPLPPEEEWDNSKHGAIYEAMNKIPYHFPSVFDMFYSEEPYDRYLVHQCFNGLVDRVPVEDYPEYLARLNIEFEEILGVSKVRKEPVSSYFITMQKIIDIIWETGSIVGTGRGSAGCFLTNYLLQIVQINPLRQGVKLDHWRFMHKSKPDMPDIDIDLSSHKRDIVFKALQRYFQSIGGDIVRVCTYGTETAKSALQTAVRGLGLNNDLGTYLSSLIPVERGQAWSLSDAYYGNPDKERDPVTEFVNQIDQYEDLLETALGIEGLVSRRGVHACFDGDTLVTTDSGLKRIADIRVGDMVLTHLNQFKQVGHTMTTETERVYTVKATSSFPVQVTGNHPLYVREAKTLPYKRQGGKWSNHKVYGEPLWKSVEELEVGKDFVGIAINQNSIVPSYEDCSLPFEQESFWWLVGRYIGDGWTEEYSRERGVISWNERRLIICCTNVHQGERDEIIKHLRNASFKYRVEKTRTTYKIHIDNNELYTYLQGFGRYAHGKHIHKDVFNLPIHLVQSFLDGYIGADGCVLSNGVYSLKTVSKPLAIGLMQLINKAYLRHVGVTVVPAKKGIIEAREVQCREQYQLRFTKEVRKKEQSFYEDGYIWTRISHVSSEDKRSLMYNLTVLDDSSYVAHGLIAHNCGALVVNEPITGYNAIMRAPNGEVTTQYTLAPSEYTGLIKYDLKL